MTSDVLLGKTLPPLPRPRKIGPEEAFEQELYDEEQDEMDIEAMELAMKEGVKAAEETAHRIEQLQITEDVQSGETKAGEMEGDEMEVEGAPLSPAASEK